MDYLALPLVLALGLLAVYVLAILLRVACHFCAVEIPVLSRALVTASLTFVLSAIAAFAIQTALIGGSRRIDAVLQFAALVMALAAHMLITVGLYMPLLSLRLDRAFSVWLVQASIFAGLAIVVGGCFMAAVML